MNRQEIVRAAPSTSTEGATRGWADGLSHFLIQHAARRAPPALSERLEEEWLADLSTHRRPLSRLLFGFGCCWATNVIAREHHALNVSAASPAAGSTTMTAYVQHDSNFFTGRSIALVTIAGLHIAVIYALASGLGPRLAAVIPEAMRTEVLQEARYIPPPLKLEVTLKHPPVDLGPPPIVKIDGTPETINTITR